MITNRHKELNEQRGEAQRVTVNGRRVAGVFEGAVSPWFMLGMGFTGEEFRAWLMRPKTFRYNGEPE